MQPRQLPVLNMVYPRGRGGTPATSERNFPQADLSPRARGNLRNDPVDRLLQGSIPAGAGEPRRSRRSRPRSRVYPRGRGGTSWPSSSSVRIRGLSPRARGNHSAPDESTKASGSIPAGAGEPARRVLEGPVLRVYPRGRGGTCASPSELTRFKGLSPRARGNRRHSDPDH